MYLHQIFGCIPSNTTPYLNTSTYPSEAELIHALKTGQSDAFACVYDQFAPVLLGIIIRTIDDPRRAELVLAETFTTIRSEVSRCPSNQPLFLWLFDITRRTAANALANAPTISPSAVQLTLSGRVMAGTDRPAFVQSSTDAKQRLLNAVLFERCTPQEASQAAGLSIEKARQHLRQAFLQLREKRT